MVTKKHPKACIIMATYNGEKYLREQLDSIIAQTYKDWVLYISDDGSKDNTVKILKEYQKKLGKDKLIITKNSRSKHGAKENFCFAIDTAPEADFYFFSDQDDVWEKDKVKLQLEEIEKLSGPSLVYCDGKIVDENLKPITEKTISEQFSKIPKKKPLNRSVFANRIAGCTMCINRELLEAAKNLNPEKIIMHDFYIVLYALSFGNLVFLDKVLNLYRQHGNNAMGAGVDYVQTSLKTKISKFFNKNFHKKWREDTRKYLVQAEHLIEKNPDKENPVMEKFIKISKYKNGAHRVISFYINHYRTEDWWVLIERGF